MLSRTVNDSDYDTNQIKRRLDEPVLSTIDMENYVIELEKIVKQLVDIRIQGGGTYKEITLTKEPIQIIKLKGADKTLNQSLDDFI